MLSELNIATGSIRTILQFGDFVVGRAVSSIGQFAAYYSDDSYIVQVNGTETDFGLLVSGKPKDPEPEPGSDKIGPPPPYYRSRFPR